MRHFVAIALIASLVGIAQSQEKKDPTTGKWVIESLIRDGKANDAMKGATRVHDGEKYTVTPVEGSKAAPVTGTYSIDTSKSPITIDMKAKGGNYDGKTLLGIAKLDGDTLTVAFAEPGKDRPTKFESTAGSSVVLVVHKKAK